MRAGGAVFAAVLGAVPALAGCGVKCAEAVRPERICFGERRGTAIREGLARKHPGGTVLEGRECRPREGGRYWQVTVRDARGATRTERIVCAQLVLEEECDPRFLHERGYFSTQEGAEADLLRADKCRLMLAGFYEDTARCGGIAGADTRANCYWVRARQVCPDREGREACGCLPEPEARRGCEAWLAAHP